MTEWIQAICAIVGIFIGICGLYIAHKQLPKITQEITNLSNKFVRKKFSFCGNCPFTNACLSPFLDDVGVFDKKNEIEDNNISDGIIKLFDEIKNYKFNGDTHRIGSKEHQECLLRKLTMALNQIGSVNMSFNFVKDENK
jgi:hypothetical protein